MELGFLYDRPQLLPQVTALLRQSFGTALGEHFYEELLTHSMTPRRLPLTVVAWEGEGLLGTVGLWRADLLSRQDLTPWMACLAVSPPHRRRGLGTALQKFLLNAARDLGFSEVYLYTTLENYYEKTNWQYQEPAYELVDDTPQKIYRIGL